MSKELEHLREDYANIKKEIEDNNKILEELLQNPLVQMYIDTYATNEEKKKELEVLEVSLTYQKMTECEHAFVRKEIVQERDYDRIVREPVYHCLKCGLTNVKVNIKMYKKLKIKMYKTFNQFCIGSVTSESIFNLSFSR